jgi:hypothetical protein
MFGNAMRTFDDNEVAEMLMHSNTLYRRLMGQEQEFEHKQEYVCPLCNRTLQRNPTAPAHNKGAAWASVNVSGIT